MECASEIQTLFPELRVQAGRRLSECTTFRVGGPCPLLIDAPSAGSLPALIKALHERNLAFLVIGQGSNLVISDEGLDCVIVRFCSEKPEIQTDAGRVTVSGSTLLDDFARITVGNNLGDLTFCTGIPGTVGGGIAGNAGAFGRQIGDHLISAEILAPDGSVRTVHSEELEFSYRHSRLKETGEILL
ncbi:MAG TPA: FAD-binding protein, partial [Tichowtungia sp.]|nr:FAD-binding protein [Tichowtungia sp.]